MENKPTIPQNELDAQPQDSQMQSPQNAQMPSVFQQTYVRFGIVPSAEELEHYARLAPDAVERFFKYAEAEQAARHQQMKNEDERKMKMLEMQMQDIKEEDKLIELHRRNSLIGLLAGFAIALILSILTFLLVMYGHDVAAGVFGGTSVVGIVTALIYGSRVSKKEILAPKE